jgi:hypothetical protein
MEPAVRTKVPDADRNNLPPGDVDPQHLPKESAMPAKSQAQQKAAGAALAAKRGDMKKSELKGASKGMEESMTEKELDEMASTKRKGKPEHVDKK